VAIPSGGDDPRPKNGDSAPSQAPPRIVWVASYPRSGNAFLRIVLDRPYGPRTSGVYDVTALEVLFWARPENAAAMELLAGPEDRREP
jgi:hypothetical protein